MRFTRAYDFKRALCEDPKAISAWFRICGRSTVVILDCELYNFNETEFTMG